MMSEKTLIRNARAIVTCDEQDRILYGADLLINGNQIEAVGRNLCADGAHVIDAAGKYCLLYTSPSPRDRG